jgi:serine/threonine-protein kinase HipA
MAHSASRSLALVQLAVDGDQWIDVGLLVHSAEITRFESFDDYWEHPGRPVLGQVFEENGPEWQPSQRVTLPNWFSHLLPEGYLRSAVSQAIGVDSKREFFLLGRLGEEDLPGAVRVVPAEDDGLPRNDAGRYVAHAGQDSVDPDNPLLKFSLAGVQPKFSVLLDPDRGLTIPARGQAGDWIVKLADGRPGFEGVPEAEFASLELARACGINVPPTQLIPADTVAGLPKWAKGTVFAIERFDRSRDQGRVHAEVLAQVLDVPTANERLKYTRGNFETIASLVGGLCGAHQVGDVLDRIVLNVLIGNGDAHLKNWAVIYPDRRLPSLSPLYDVLPTILYIATDDLGLKLNGSRSFRDVGIGSFDRLLSRSDWDQAEGRARVASMVERIAENWHVLASALPADAYSLLTDHRNSIPLFRLRR